MFIQNIRPKLDNKNLPWFSAHKCMTRSIFFWRHEAFLSRLFKHPCWTVHLRRRKMSLIIHFPLTICNIAMSPFWQTNHVCHESRAAQTEMQDVVIWISRPTAHALSKLCCTMASLIMSSLKRLAFNFEYNTPFVVKKSKKTKKIVFIEYFLCKLKI